MQEQFIVYSGFDLMQKFHVFLDKGDLTHKKLFMFEKENQNSSNDHMVCAMSSFDGLLPCQRDLLSYCTGLCGGDKKKLLLLLCVYAGGNILLSPDERIRMLNSKGYKNILCCELHPDKKYSSTDFPGEYEAMVPGADIWKHKELIKLLKGRYGAKINDSFQGHDTPDHEKISAMIAEGRVDEAARLLGYAFPLEGKVVEGNKIGRTLGYPTANLRLSDPQKILPGQGVYTAVVNVSGSWYNSMVNIGIRPTLDLENVTVEAHIFDFERDIYGETISISFLSRIRDEMRFNSLSQLKTQLNHDRQSAIRMLDEDLERINKGVFAELQEKEI